MSEHSNTTVVDGSATLGRISPEELRGWIADGEELAILDVREEGVYSTGHLLLACSVPLSRLELRIRRLVPRRTTRLVLADAGDETLARRAAKILARYGYAALSVLAGGLDAWRAAGYEVYSGVHVPSKAFGEYVEHRDETPRISAADLKARIDAGEKLVIVDSRPLDEYRVMNIPGAIDCPGAELVYRVPGLLRDPTTTVVVNCAGRTRSIIGAQSLINAGLPNPVLALKNGTMGWHLAGIALEHGNTREAPAPDAAALARAQAMAAGVAERFGVRQIDRAALETLRGDAGRTVYVFDVRTAAEFVRGHLPGAIHAPGGQLVQGTDAFAAVRNARLVLADDEGVRAPMTASWLLQLGWREVFVLHSVGGLPDLETGEGVDEPLGLEALTCPGISVEQLLRMRARGAPEFLDFADSATYRRGHLPGAGFAVRARLADCAAALDRKRLLVCLSPDGVLARYAAQDLSALGFADVSFLQGGTRAWRKAGQALESGAQRMLSAADDVWAKPYDRGAQVESAMQDYLQWEVALVEQIRTDPDVRFRDFPERAAPAL